MNSVYKYLLYKEQVNSNLSILVFTKKNRNSNRLSIELLCVSRILYASQNYCTKKKAVDDYYRKRGNAWKTCLYLRTITMHFGLSSEW